MAKKKNKKLTPTQQQYQRLAADIEPKRPVVANCLKAFLSGGENASGRRLFTLAGSAIKMRQVRWPPCWSLRPSC